MTYRSKYAGISWIAPDFPFDLDPAFELDTLGVQWICGICDGAEISAPGYEPPSPAICPTCARLSMLDALAALGVTL